jgi:hypothetical protein
VNKQIGSDAKWHTQQNNIAIDTWRKRQSCTLQSVVTEPTKESLSNLNLTLVAWMAKNVPKTPVIPARTLLSAATDSAATDSRTPGIAYDGEGTTVLLAAALDHFLALLNDGFLPTKVQNLHNELFFEYTHAL